MDFITNYLRPAKGRILGGLSEIGIKGEVNNYPRSFNG